MRKKTKSEEYHRIFEEKVVNLILNCEKHSPSKKTLDKPEVKIKESKAGISKMDIAVKRLDTMSH